MATEALDKISEKVSANVWRLMAFVGLGTMAGTAIAIPIAQQGVAAAALFSPPQLLLYSWVATLCSATFVLLVTLKPFRVRVLTVMIVISLIVTLVQMGIRNGATATLVELLRPTLLGLLLPWCFAVGRGRLIFSRKYMLYFPILGPVVGFGVCLPMTIATLRLLNGFGARTPDSFELAVYAGWLSAFIGLAIHLMQKPFREADPRKQALYSQILRQPASSAD